MPHGYCCPKEHFYKTEAELDTRIYTTKSPAAHLHACCQVMRELRPIPKVPASNNCMVKSELTFTPIAIWIKLSTRIDIGYTIKGIAIPPS